MSAAAARRVALGAQGLVDSGAGGSGPEPGSLDRRSDGSPPGTGAVDRRHVRRAIGQLGAVQLDSVNVVARAHELTLFARLGPYDRGLPWRMQQAGDLFEYWGHEASLLPVELQPLLRWRMARADQTAWSGLVRLGRDEPGYVEAVFDEVRERGPLSAGELSEPGARTGPWWGWHRGKQALEYLFWSGRLAARRRHPSFERVYDLPQRVLPAAVLARPTPDEADAQRELLARAGRSLGVGTATDLVDYYRLPRRADVRALLDDLVEDGALLAVTVEGWRQPAYLDPAARHPRRAQRRALLSPFDSLVWFRERTERLFGFRFRLELYTPAARRVHGYYVVPFLQGERLVARVDLKADRRAGVLRVPAAWIEPGVDEAAVVVDLRRELTRLAAWLGLGAVAVGARGDLSAALAATR